MTHTAVPAEIDGPTAATHKIDLTGVASNSWAPGSPVYDTVVEPSYVGRDGRTYRRVRHWCCPGWRSSTDVLVDGRWRGSGF